MRIVASFTRLAQLLRDLNDPVTLLPVVHQDDDLVLVEITDEQYAKLVKVVQDYAIETRYAR